MLKAKPQGDENSKFSGQKPVFYPEHCDRKSKFHVKRSTKRYA